MEKSTERVLISIDYAILAGGGIVLLLWLLHWCLTGLRDPLRGSPLRPHRLGLLSVWICLLAYPLGAIAWAGLANWTAGVQFSKEQLDLWRSLAASNFTVLMLIVICLAVAQPAFVGGWRGFGLRNPRGRFGWVFVPGGWLVAMLITQLLLLVCSHILLKMGYKAPDHNVFQALNDKNMPAWIHQVAIGGALVLAPIGEEIFFRGIIQSALRRLVLPRHDSYRHRWFAILAAGTLFGLAHISNLRDVLPLAAFGIILGYLYERTGSLYVPILVHMLFNAKPLLWITIMRNGT